MKGKVAIVSGAATLIGEKVAKALLEEGVRVAIADINAKDGKRIAKHLGSDCTFIETDVTSDTAIENCVKKVARKWGGIDILVNVACTYLDGGMSSSRADWLTSLNVNVVAGAIFVQKVVPYMEQRGGGCIVNFSSIGGKIAQPTRLLYSVSKAAILGMTRNQALLLAESRIRVNSVSPGWTWSNVIRDFSGNNRKKADAVAAPFHLNGRLVDPEEVANAVVFLCSDRASGINGSDLAVDGGYTAIGPEQKTDQVSQLGK